MRLDYDRQPGAGWYNNFQDLPTGGNEISTPWDNWVGCAPNRRYMLHCRDHSRLSWRPPETVAYNNTARPVQGYNRPLRQFGSMFYGGFESNAMLHHNDQWTGIQSPASKEFEPWFQDSGLLGEIESRESVNKVMSALPVMNFFNAQLREDLDDRYYDFESGRGPLKNYVLRSNTKEKFQTLNNAGFFSVAYLYSMAAQREASERWYPEDYADLDQLIDKQMSEVPHYLLKNVSNVSRKYKPRTGRGSMHRHFQGETLLRGNATYRSRSIQHLTNNDADLLHSGWSGIPRLEQITRVMGKESLIHSSDLLSQRKLRGVGLGSPDRSNSAGPMGTNRSTVSARSPLVSAPVVIFAKLC